MISLDSYITEFIANNMLTIGVFMIGLKALAENTPFTWDNKVVDVLSSMFDAIVKRNKGVSSAEK